jgi:opacity protein-like surface antigen
MKTAALLAGLALGFSSIAPAVAQDEVTGANQLNGWYATLGSGFVAPQSPSLSYSSAGYNYTGSINQNTAYSGEIGGGYDFGPVRAEFTYAYTPISSSQWNVNWNGGSASAPVATSYNLSSFLFSGFYDVKTKSKFTPYIGGGIGPGIAVIPSVNTSLNGTTFRTNSESQAVFAYQAKAGVSYAASKEADLFVEAGYLGASGATYNITSSAVPGVNTPISIGANGGFIAKLGFRYRFGK